MSIDHRRTASGRAAGRSGPEHSAGVPPGWKWAVVFFGIALAATLQGCKIQVIVPPGGKVVTESKVFTCKPRETCEIEVVDQFFAETFVARANPGFEFMGWEKLPSAFCGDRYGPCALSTEGFDLFPKLLAILASDNVFYLKPKFERIPSIRREDLTADGDVVPVTGGIDVLGDLVLTTGSGLQRLFSNTDLRLGFSAESGNLETMDGTGILPEQLTPRLSIDAGVRAQFSYLTGRQINEDEAIGITLRDERRYLVFLVDGSLSYTAETPVPDRNGKPAAEKKQVTIDTPAGGKVVLILDPNDDMIYRYGENALLGASGEAESDQGLIPFVPDYEGSTKVYRFDGHRYKTVSVGVGIKALDVLNLTGEQVTWQPDLFDVDLGDPFHSPFAYRAGFNGAAEVAISVLGFSARDYFNFDLGEASAAFEVSADRQVMTLAAELAPDVSWAPDWLPVLPTTRLAFDLTANGKGHVVINLAGSYASQLPEADIEGSMRLTPQALTLNGRVPGVEELPVTITFRDGNTYATVGITADIAARVGAEVARGFDRAEDQVASAMERLEQAAADYEFELSLRGLRESLPGLADAAITEMNKVPGSVYSAVYADVKDAIDARNECVTNPLNGKKTCIISTSTRNAAARDAAAKAEAEARKRISAYVSVLAELKRSAVEDDRVELVSRLEAALRAAYAKRSFRETITVTVTVAVPGPDIRVTRSHTVSRTVLSTAQADAVLAAADNIHLIPETSDRVIGAREIVDRLPTREVIDAARRSVEQGTAAIPAVKGVTYAIEDGEYSASVLMNDGSRYVVDYNVLDWRELTEGIGDLLAGIAIETL